MSLWPLPEIQYASDPLCMQPEHQPTQLRNSNSNKLTSFSAPAL